MEVSVGVEVDPIKYEMFVHRLHNIAEEGRIALQRVTASPIVVQGGECMSAFYASDGTTILSASGHLRFSAGCADAVRKIVALFEEDPGIYDGDQFFLNDPYVCSTHVYDQMIVKPIFHQGRRLGWTGLFGVVVCAGDLPQRKPDPAPLVHGLRRLQVLPAAAAYVGDTVEDVEMGRAAGVTTLAVLGGFSSREALEAARPARLLNSLRDLVALLAV